MVRIIEWQGVVLVQEKIKRASCIIRFNFITDFGLRLWPFDQISLDKALKFHFPCDL